MKNECDPLKGAVAGALGGLAGAFLMNYSHTAWSKGSKIVKEALDSQPNVEKKSDGDADDSSEDENATEKMAEAISKTLFDHELTDDEKKPASIAVHYGFGMTMGALFGAIAELEPRAAAGVGLPFGTALWAVADEVVVPAAGLSEKPATYPLSTHAEALVAHLVFGLTTDLVRRGLRSVS
ncbi:MAG: DUF1440 domain-containing protein [Acidobacteriota bacterium]